MFKGIDGDRLHPTMFHPAFLTLRPLSRALTPRLDSVGKNALLLDLGGGESPYRTLLVPRGVRYVSTDLDPASRASVLCTAESLAIASGTMDVVLCTQVLEHVDDPHRTLAEIYRVLKPGGLVLLSTHGAFPWHPSPNDYWRWTHQGLKKIFSDAGFTGVEVMALGHSVTSMFQNSIVFVERISWPGWLRFKIIIPFAFAMNVAGTIAETAARRLNLGAGYDVMLAPAFLVAAKK